MEPRSITERLAWRYAVEKFDAGRIIPDDTWRELENAMVLAPSSYGLQPWRFVVVTDRALRESLVPSAWGQRQVADCSHLVVMCRRTEITEADVDAHLVNTARVRSQSLESLAEFRAGMMRTLANPGALPGGSMEAWTRAQVYIALGVFVGAAAMVGVDTCPMEGFRPADFDRALGLGGSGYTSVVLAPAGYRAADDWLATQAKVRFPAARVVARV